ncbi:MAG: hypothetical protein IPL05_03720 [Betaproteobacteria bacterium]|nr:hypothetical protein [Betaproteobacteria bacterium]
MIANQIDVLAIWSELCKVFAASSVVQPSKEDLALSLQSWKNDHVTLCANSPSWRAASKLTATLSTAALKSLLDLAKVNATHINSHLTFTIGSVVSVPLAIYGLFREPLSVLLQRSGAFGTGGLVVAVVAGFWLIYALWKSKWQSMELQTFLETSIALKSAEGKELP